MAASTTALGTSSSRHSDSGGAVLLSRGAAGRGRAWELDVVRLTALDTIGCKCSSCSRPTDLRGAELYDRRRGQGAEGPLG